MNLLHSTLTDFCLLAAADHAWGVAAFVGVYVLLLVWLFLLPARLLGESPGAPWWQRSRVWAVVITIVQIMVYLGLG